MVFHTIVVLRCFDTPECFLLTDPFNAYIALNPELMGVGDHDEAICQREKFGIANNSDRQKLLNYLSWNGEREGLLFAVIQDIVSTLNNG